MVAMWLGGWLVGCAATGGPVDGPADDHCDGVDPVTVDPSACDAGTATETETSTATDDDEYGETMFGTVGDDDDCKYHLEWSSDDVRRDEDVTFTLTATALEDGSPVTGADPRAEVFLDETHPAPNSGATFTETGDGVYAIGPVRFDASGQWTVRFHLFEDCADGETSPHGHGAFFVEVP